MAFQSDKSTTNEVLTAAVPQKTKGTKTLVTIDDTKTKVSRSSIKVVYKEPKEGKHYAMQIRLL